MNRRDALYHVSLLFGGSVVGANLFLQGCGSATEGEASSQEKARQASAPDLFSVEQVALLDEVGETILPTSDDSPGAKAAGIGAFMHVIVADCYNREEQQRFEAGLAELEQRSQKAYQQPFAQLATADRQALLTTLDGEAKAYDEALSDQNAARAKDARLDPLPPHYFTMMKQLTLWGYFTSEVGATQALRYVPVPGRYDGCIPYAKGDKAWALS
jgi:hypothetical protein